MEEKSNLVKGLTLATMFTLITGAMVGMACGSMPEKWVS